MAKTAWRPGDVARCFASPTDGISDSSDPVADPGVLQETGLAIAVFGEWVGGELCVVNCGGSTARRISAP